ncbi:MAG: dCMP deaminase, partial [Actinomycetota bacterium]|nr:dCMP deaminase [Actinomycetota bacterium]
MAERRVVERDWYYMGLAEAVAGRANCQGTKVGAVLVRDDRVLGTGFNGTPTGFT